MNVAVIGVGYLGQFHYQKLCKISEVNLLGAFDLNLDRCKEVVSQNQGRVFKNVNEVSESVDLVFISSISSSHYELGKFFLNQGKHCFIEKPLCEKSLQALELSELADKKNLKLQVGHLKRFHPLFKKFKSEFRNPAALRFERYSPFKNRALDVDIISDVMIHDIEMCINLVGAKPRSIKSNGHKLKTIFFDYVESQVEFENGTTASFCSHRLGDKTSRKIQAMTNEKFMCLDFTENTLHKIEKNTESIIEKIDKVDTLFLEDKGFIDSILKNETPHVSGQDAFKAIELSEQIRNAIT